jgi:hypothetical protein
MDSDGLVVECSSGTAPERVRSWLRSKLALVLGGSAAATDLVDDALLCTNELVINALQARCTTATVRYSLSDTALRLAVIDDAGGRPELRHPTPNDTRGRGLLLVNAIAHRWGIASAGSGKEVWVEILRPA